jgi:hypothetical protein
MPRASQSFSEDEIRLLHDVLTMMLRSARPQEFDHICNHKAFPGLLKKIDKMMEASGARPLQG